MAKMIKCKTCGEMIAKSAKRCPHCGAKKKTSALAAILCIIVIFVAVVAIAGVIAESGGQSGPKKVSSASEQSSPAEQPSPTEQTVFGPGDKVEMNDIIVSMTNFYESTGSGFSTPSDGKVFLICEFEIENNSKSDIAVSSLMSFEAYVDDYTANMSLSAIMSADKGQLDGTVAVGKKLSGVIGYEADPGRKELEIRFTPNFWTGKDITFVCTHQ